MRYLPPCSRAPHLFFFALRPTLDKGGVSQGLLSSMIGWPRWGYWQSFQPTCVAGGAIAFFFKRVVQLNGLFFYIIKQQHHLHLFFVLSFFFRLPASGLFQTSRPPAQARGFFQRGFRLGRVSGLFYFSCLRCTSPANQLSIPHLRKGTPPNGPKRLLAWAPPRPSPGGLKHKPGTFHV